MHQVVWTLRKLLGIMELLHTIRNCQHSTTKGEGREWEVQVAFSSQTMVLYSFTYHLLYAGTYPQTQAPTIRGKIILLLIGGHALCRGTPREKHLATRHC